jgi:hypothetical protein
MTVRYEYKSACCGHEYIEQRAADEPMFFPTCNDCGNDDYELVKETVFSDEVKRAAGPETPTE